MGKDTYQKHKKDILPVNTKSLWNSVKIAEDQIVEPISQKLYKEGNTVNDKNVCEEFLRKTIFRLTKPLYVQSTLSVLRCILKTTANLFNLIGSTRNLMHNIKSSNEFEI